MGLISQAGIYILMGGSQFSPVPPFLSPNFTNGLLKESLNIIGFVIVGAQSIFTYCYGLSLSRHRTWLLCTIKAREDTG